MMGRFASALLILLVSCSATWGNVIQMTVDGRPFLLAQPDSASNEVLPLIVALNGAGSDGEKMAQSLPLIQGQSSARFRVAYLNASKFMTASGRMTTAWNDGVCCGPGIRPDVDDAGYISDVIDYIESQGLVENGRTVAVVGHSNGAQMGYRLACEHGDRIFALVAISGAIVEKNCVALKGLRVLNIVGSNDDRYPAAGGRSKYDPRIVHDSIEAAGQSLANFGASVKLQLVPGAKHPLWDIDQAMFASSGTGLVDFILSFVFSPG